MEFFKTITIEYIASVFYHVDVTMLEVDELHKLFSKQNLRVSSEYEV